MSDKTPDESWQEFVAAFPDTPLHDPLRKLFHRAGQGDRKALLQLYSEASHYTASAFSLRLSKASFEAREDQRRETKRQNASHKRGKLAWHNQVLDVLLKALRLSDYSHSNVIRELAKCIDNDEMEDLLDKLNSRERDLRVAAIEMADPDPKKVVLYITPRNGTQTAITKDMLRHAIRRPKEKI